MKHARLFVSNKTLSRNLLILWNDVGFGQGGKLSERIRLRPYSVTLLDEVEKLHVQVLDILLQVLDDGHLTDDQGGTVDFTNTVIILALNSESNFLSSASSALTDPFDDVTVIDCMKNPVTKIVSGRFRPEFLGRLDEILIL